MPAHRPLAACLLALAALGATETEHLDFQIVPAPGPVSIDGDKADWDLSGGILACADVENQRDSYALWFHAMYDAKNLYVLAHWRDATPMNNPGSTKGDYGFRGDCMQFRIVTHPDVRSRDVGGLGRDAKDSELMRTNHIDAWCDRDGLDTLNVGWGKRFNEGGHRNLKEQGAAQVFRKDADGKGYVQELSIPWSLLTKPGVEIKPGMEVLLTLEPNFTTPDGGRLTIKDIFKPGVAIDRIFTFQGNACWGYATLAKAGKLKPRPVRLSDGREFPVHFEGTMPRVDWTGLIQSRLPDGFAPVRFDMPEDGYVSLNLYAEDGSVACQMLRKDFFAKGPQEVKWDGLTTISWRKPGEVVKPGTYRWEGIWHTGLGLKLRGWAGNNGPAPWSGWGADHGCPVAVAADGKQVYVGWQAGEGDKPLLACNPKGEIKWKNIRGGIAGANRLASDGRTVYVFNWWTQYTSRAIYRVDARTGGYTEWTRNKSTDLTMDVLWPELVQPPETPEELAQRKLEKKERAPSQMPQNVGGLAAGDGKLFASFGGQNTLMVIDGASGEVLKRIEVGKIGDIATRDGKTVFCLADGGVVAVEVGSGTVKPFARPERQEREWLSGIALGADGEVFIGIREGRQQVLVFDAAGKQVRSIGRSGGRARIGKWTPDGMLSISGLAIDCEGKLWVTEDDNAPRRVSVWDAKSGAFVREHFGGTNYGAGGGSVNPLDSSLIVGQGCEWRIDAKTGQAACLGTIIPSGMGEARFGFGPDRRLYLAVAADALHGDDPVRIYERVAEADYRLRTVIAKLPNEGAADPKAKGKAPPQPTRTRVWSDENGDGVEQDGEAQVYEKELGGWFEGWYLPMTYSMTFYGTRFQVAPTGWTACGAPKYDLSKAKEIGSEGQKFRSLSTGYARRGLGSADDRLMLWNCAYSAGNSEVTCQDIASGRVLWTYPSNHTGVHGSHNAGGPEPGLIRGAFDLVGTVKLPEPIGSVWLIPTNKGEWHALTERGFYLSGFFEPDPTRYVYPDRAAPGADISRLPPGAGEEAFGGSLCLDQDGKLILQAGHVSYWVAEVTGLETVKKLGSGSVTIAPEDIPKAEACRVRLLQSEIGTRKVVVKKATVAFTGDPDKDFAGAEALRYRRQDNAGVATRLAWDDSNLYVAWSVADDSPWMNAAEAPEAMYTKGDSVDLQLSTDPGAAKDHKDGVLGDLRLSIGNFKGKPVAVIYRKVAAEKHPMVFNSGVTKGYSMDSVTQVEIKTEVAIAKNRRSYVVEAAIPLATLGLKPAAGLVLKGDVGATHGNKEGTDTVLRTFWSNQNTGLVSDEVYELQLHPANWGELKFAE